MDGVRSTWSRDSRSPRVNTIRGGGRGRGSELISVLDDVVSLPLRQNGGIGSVQRSDQKMVVFLIQLRRSGRTSLRRERPLGSNQHRPVVAAAFHFSRSSRWPFTSLVGDRCVCPKE
jgi:hypothetical protein